jgi:Uncharacterized protein conserved in archaea (DUF2180)
MNEMCLHCAEQEEPREAPATHLVSGMPLCTDHAVAEVEEIIRNPETFVHSWPTGQDRVEWGDAVPFYTEIRMIEP